MLRCISTKYKLKGLRTTGDVDQWALGKSFQSWRYGNRAVIILVPCIKHNIPLVNKKLKNKRHRPINRGIERAKKRKREDGSASSCPTTFQTRYRLRLQLKDKIHRPTGRGIERAKKRKREDGSAYKCPIIFQNKQGSFSALHTRTAKLL